MDKVKTFGIVYLVYYQKSWISHYEYVKARTALEAVGQIALRVPRVPVQIVEVLQKK